MKNKRVTAFAPATVGNVAVGFDLMGFAVDCAGDEVTLEALPGTREVKIDSIGSWTGGREIESLPRDPHKNTATAGLIELIEKEKLKHGFSVRIRKGIALGSGMGGSAASAAAAIMAASEFLKKKLPMEKLLEYALIGEQVASGARHADNLAPCLWGGMTCVVAEDPFHVVQIPVPSRLVCVLVRPQSRLDTRDARGILRGDLALKDHVKQSASLAGVLAGCYTDDLKLIGKTLRDHVIEPQRASLIKGFDHVAEAAREAGALGCSISGAGPAVFAWVDGKSAALKVKEIMVAAFHNSGVECEAWISPVGARGARIVGSGRQLGRKLGSKIGKKLRRR